LLKKPPGALFGGTRPYGARLSFETKAGRSRAIKGRVLNMSTSGVLVEALRPVAIGLLKT
jgi:hypothetical protein